MRRRRMVKGTNEQKDKGEGEGYSCEFNNLQTQTPFAQELSTSQPGQYRGKYSKRWDEN